MSSIPKNAQVPQAGLEITLKFLQVSMNNVEQLVNFQIASSRHQLDNYARSIHLLSKANTPQEAFSQFSALAKDHADKAVESSGELCNILSKAQEDLQDLALEHINALQQSLQGMSAALNPSPDSAGKK